MSTFTTMIELPAQVHFRNVGGEPVYLDLSAIPSNVIAELVTGGVKIISTNTWNGGGKDTPETERLAAVQKRWDSWKRGEYLITERGASQAALMRECYVEEMRAKFPDTTAKAIEQKMKETVKEAFGKDVNATFDNFLRAVAKQMASKDMGADEVFARLTAKYEAKAAALEAERSAAATVKIDLTAIDLD